jgi:hypothetical protein
MQRGDISDCLIHWTKGDSHEEAFNTLRSIVFSHRLFGGTGSIKGQFNCVCFTEAPGQEFHKILGRYKPFGIQVSKVWAYAQGGRPVIYQSDTEYDLLPDALKWRHVRYEPHTDPPIDFTWEREWRIQTGELILPLGEAVVVVPDDSWAERLEDEHLTNEEYQARWEAMVYGDWAYAKDADPFPYSFHVLAIEI